MNPTTTIFKIHFKSILINNLATSHFVGANCEKYSAATITAIKNFVNQPQRMKEDIILDKELDILRKLNISAIVRNRITKLATGYVSGFVFKKLQKLLVNCEIYRSSILTQAIDDEWSSLTLAMEYSVCTPDKSKYCAAVQN